METLCVLGFILIGLWVVGRYYYRKNLSGYSCRKMAMELFLLFGLGSIVSILFLYLS